MLFFIHFLLFSISDCVRNTNFVAAPMLLLQTHRNSKLTFLFLQDDFLAYHPLTGQT